MKTVIHVILLSEILYSAATAFPVNVHVVGTTLASTTVHTVHDLTILSEVLLPPAECRHGLLFISTSRTISIVFLSQFLYSRLFNWPRRKICYTPHSFPLRESSNIAQKASVLTYHHRAPTVWKIQEIPQRRKIRSKVSICPIRRLYSGSLVGYPSGGKQQKQPYVSFTSPVHIQSTFAPHFS